MTMAKVIKLRAWSPAIEGEGGELVVKLEAYRPHRLKRGDASWRGNVWLSVDRYFVLQLMRAVDEMQKRDRDRLARERSRLDLEVEPVQRRANSQESK